MFKCTVTLPDQRVDGWLLVDTLLTPTTISLLYLLVVWLGPLFMKGRQPFQLKWVLVVYNLGMVGLSVYMFYEVSLSIKLCKRAESSEAVAIIAGNRGIFESSTYIVVVCNTFKGMF